MHELRCQCHEARGPRNAAASSPPLLAVAGEWQSTRETLTIVDPLNGEEFIRLPDTKNDEIQGFVDAMRSVPKSGLHNPLKNPER